MNNEYTFLLVSLQCKVFKCYFYITCQTKILQYVLHLLSLSYKHKFQFKTDLQCFQQDRSWGRNTSFIGGRSWGNEERSGGGARRVLKMSEVCLVLLHSNVLRLFPRLLVPPSYFKLVFPNGNIKLGSKWGEGED